MLLLLYFRESSISVPFISGLCTFSSCKYDPRSFLSWSHPRSFCAHLGLSGCFQRFHWRPRLCTPLPSSPVNIRRLPRARDHQTLLPVQFHGNAPLCLALASNFVPVDSPSNASVSITSCRPSATFYRSPRPADPRVLAVACRVRCFVEASPWIKILRLEYPRRRTLHNLLATTLFH